MENNLDLKNGKDTKRDIFDKIMSLPVLRIFEPFYKKYKDILLYIFFGGLTTIVSFVTFWVCCDFFEIHELVSNTISWVASVTFAFFTNRIWVFSAPTKTWGEFFKQAAEFYGGRIFTYVFEQVCILIFVTILSFNELLIKLLANIGVLILNYLISKFLVFRKKEN